VTPARLAHNVVPLRRDQGIADEELVRRARAGEAWAKDAIVRRYFVAVAGTVARLLGRVHEAEDVVQDSFAAALEDLDDLRDPGALRGWLIQIAVRKVHRRFRKRRLLRLLGLDRGDDQGLADLAADSASPEHRAELVLLDAALQKLAAVDRIAWTLRYVEGMPLQDVAQSAGCSLATAKRRIAAADRVVRAHVAIEGGE
jgi:RNA polymerase sigma-70 factor, ECF subfamily